MTAQHSTAQHSTAQHSTAQHSTAQHSTVPYILLAFCALFLSGIFTDLLAQRRAKAKNTPSAEAGVRLASFSTTGDLKESLPSGIGLNLYYDQPFAFFLSGKLPGYMPSSLQAMLNYESLSHEDTDKNEKNSLSRIGLELGPTWLFSLASSQYLALIVTAGFAQGTARRESTLSVANSEPPLEESALQFSSHFLIHYEYHYSDFVFSAGSYTVYGADEEVPLIATGFNLGLGYKF